MTRLLRRLFSILAFVGVFAWLLTGAVDQELASGGVLNERENRDQAALTPAASPTGMGSGSLSLSALPEREVESTDRSDLARAIGLPNGGDSGGTRPTGVAASRSVSACGASSIGPSGTVTVTSCGEGLSERAAATAGSMSARSESLYQGKPVRWWARRAVQARKDANARARTIRRLQSAARRELAYPTGHWLDGAFLCIHRYERGAAGWQTSTGNGYRGGLQFDSSFARTHGPAWAFRAFGNVERWPASVQIAAAVQAWTTRGFGPWPSTRLRCGL